MDGVLNVGQRAACPHVELMLIYYPLGFICGGGAAQPFDFSTSCKLLTRRNPPLILSKPPNSFPFWTESCQHLFCLQNPGCIILQGFFCLPLLLIWAILLNHSLIRDAMLYSNTCTCQPLPRHRFGNIRSSFLHLSFLQFTTFFLF